MTISSLFVLAAVICFLLVTFGVAAVGHVALTPLGLAFFAIGHLSFPTRG